VRLARTD